LNSLTEVIKVIVIYIQLFNKDWFFVKNSPFLLFIFIYNQGTNKLFRR